MSGWETLASSALFRAVAWALIHFLWQGAAVAVTLALVLAVVPRRFSRLRYAAAGSAMGLMLLLPVATGLILGVGSGAPAGRAPAADLGAALVEIWSTPVESNPQPGFGSGAGLPTRVEPWLPAVVFLWLAGVGLLSLRNFGGLVGLRGLTRSGVFPAPASWEATLARLAGELRVPRAVRLVGSHRVGVPMVVGWLRPVVLVPASAFSGLAPHELEAILVHELAHVRRHDFFFNVVQTFVETLLFYHPAVWWVSRQMREERENCCDDIAVAACGNVRVYAGALARMEVLRSAAPSPALGADGGSLLSRIARLAGKRHRGEASPARWIAGMVTLAAVLGLGVLTPVLDAGRIGAELQETQISPRASHTVSRAERASASAVLAGDGASGAGAMETAREAYGVAVEGREGDDGAPVAMQAYEVAVLAGAGDGEGGWSGSPDRGRWRARYDVDDGDLWIDVRVDGNRWSTRTSLSRLGVSERQVESLLAGETIDFEFVREAGTFRFEGDVDEGGREASGTFRFRADPEYTEAMTGLGYRAREVEDRQMELAGHDVTMSYVRNLVASGYRDPSLSRLIEFRIHGITPEYVRGMAASGLDLDAKRLVEFRIHGITPEYVRAMAKSGYEDLSPGRIVEFKIHGITPEFVRGMAASGIDLDAKRLVEFRIHGITPEYARAMAKSGYEDLSPGRIVEFKIHGITPEYVRGMAASGLDLDAKRLVEFRVHGITPEYVRGMAASGIDLDAKRLVEFRIHGITPEYLRELNELGYGDMPPRKVVEFRIHGVTPESVRMLRERGLDDLTPQEVIELHVSGVHRILSRRN